jgi:hypothetical protein
MGVTFSPLQQGSARSYWRPGYAPADPAEMREDVEWRLELEDQWYSADSRGDIPYLKAVPLRLFSSLCLKDGELEVRDIYYSNRR